MNAAADRKLFLGARLKRLRRDLGLTQTAMAADLDVSPSYLNHIERNQRPVSAQLLLRLADTYDVDLRALNQGGAADEARLTEILTDPLFKGLSAPRHELVQLLEEAPGVADALLRLYQAFDDGRTRARAAAETGESLIETSPAEWVREYIQSRGNHFSELDQMGEALSDALSAEAPAHADGFEPAARHRLAAKHDLGVRTLPAEVMVEWTRRYDLHRRRLLLSETLGPSSRAFAIAYQLALAEQGPALNALAEAANAPDGPTRSLLKVALTNTLAAATLMPYAAFQRAAEETRYDLARVQARFGVSYEQAAHRLTTLSRPTARGVPFFLMRVDQAGNISKRYAAGAFPFSRFGGACPRWRLHSAFRTPGRIVTQIIETPDGGRWFTFARTVERQGHDGYGERHDLAVGLGCELRHAHRLAYAHGVDLQNPDVTPIGPACRLCHRHPCAERAAAPIDRPLAVDDWSKSVSPYPFGAA
ncbi:putative transcriptional regulator/DNA-binding XRE family transcriptional regulator [Brevundimonas vesicularis]|uniref:Putative transcriptional regulator/DNA-binding XRE family transcriptional regulator n=1 Tax=Brevundimonas vesicularis TaxID=41276 RepID=A0A7W9FRC6_BREVE|nr:helix-turn-helix transcriptional regulator [Brevundimonas vesicularis]MBB5770107.1 putative transcriptional regulator/DNA-binding XRE family transcriptional regulator [Brevundimonas vesicularis]